MTAHECFAARLLLVRTAARLPGRLVPACDGGDDGEFVFVGGGGGFLVGQVANVFVVEVDVDEGAELTLRGVQVPLELRERRGQVFECCGDGLAGDVDCLLTAGVGAQGSGDVNLHCA